jgi:hypothetical protein
MLVAANLVPLVGVYALGWDVGVLLMLYWLENAVVGGYTALKMAVVAKGLQVLAIPFFVFHYGMFMLGHLAFLTVLFLGGGPFGNPVAAFSEALPAALAAAFPALLALVASHGVSFVAHFLVGGERQRQHALQIMFSPYRRVIVLHMTIIFGAFVVVALNEARAALFVFVAVKIVVDALAHLRAHALSGAPSGRLAAFWPALGRRRDV